jgi:hypothetical protein
MKRTFRRAIIDPPGVTGPVQKSHAGVSSKRVRRHQWACEGHHLWAAHLSVLGGTARSGPCILIKSASPDRRTITYADQPIVQPQGEPVLPGCRQGKCYITPHDHHPDLLPAALTASLPQRPGKGPSAASVAEPVIHSVAKRLGFAWVACHDSFSCGRIHRLPPSGSPGVLRRDRACDGDSGPDADQVLRKPRHVTIHSSRLAILALGCWLNSKYRAGVPCPLHIPLRTWRLRQLELRGRALQTVQRPLGTMQFARKPLAVCTTGTARPYIHELLVLYCT